MGHSISNSCPATVIGKVRESHGKAQRHGCRLPEALMATEPAVMQMINVSSVEGRGPQEIGVDEFKRNSLFKQNYFRK